MSPVVLFINTAIFTESGNVEEVSFSYFCNSDSHKTKSFSKLFVLKLKSINEASRPIDDIACEGM